MSDSEMEILKNNPEYMAVLREIIARQNKPKRDKWGHVIKPKKGRVGRPPVNSDFAGRYAEHGAALLQLVLATPELRPLLEDGIARLSERRSYKPDPDGPSPARRKLLLRYNRRLVFRQLGEMALPLYLVAHTDAHPAFHEFPNRVIVAFTAQCVREYFRRFHDNPDYERA